MKIQTLTLLILLSVGTVAHAQPGLIQQGNQWYYNVYCLIAPNCGYTHYSVGQDTLINDVSGTIVHENSLQELATEPETEVIILRQSNDTVFRYSPEAEIWHMLYDFGAQPGDIWEIQTDTYVGYGEVDQQELFKVSVDSIDQIVIGQDIHRVVYTSAWTDGIEPSDFHFGNSGGRIIEGIGPVDQAHGLIGQSVFEMLPLQNPSFACFLSNGELIWGSDSSPCNALSVEESERNLVELSIYPNPALEKLNISVNEALPKSGEIYNTLGMRVESFSISDRETQVDIHKLNPGIYFLKVQLENGQNAVRKFVKAR